MSTVKTKSGRVLELPSKAEDAQIHAGIAADPDTSEADSSWWKQAKPNVKPGRPPSESPKVATNIRFDRDVLEALRATGSGWQTRVNDAVRELLKKGRL